MKWKELEKFAERNGWKASCDGNREGPVHAYLELAKYPGPAVVAIGCTPNAAERILCDAVEKIRAAK